jgi:hypothetical protein
MKRKAIPGVVLTLAVFVGAVHAGERKQAKDDAANDFRTPILPPLRGGKLHDCKMAPNDARVLRATFISSDRKQSAGSTITLDDVCIVKTCILDKIDPPRFFPLVGPAQLHHLHWKCTVHYTVEVKVGYPVPLHFRQLRVEVVYMDLDHLHLFEAGK